MKMEDIYKSAANFIEQIVKNESEKQGHYLTGALDKSFEYDMTLNSKEQILTGNAAHYIKYLNEGVKAESVSFNQFPFVFEFFKLRGLDEEEAKIAAGATINKWMKEGMPTEASKKYSKTGSRKNLLESAFTEHGHKLDEHISNSFDFAVDEQYKMEKSETI